MKVFATICSLFFCMTHIHAIDMSPFAIDFDISMGKDNSYLKPHYSQFFEALRGYNRWWFNYIQHKNPTEIWNFFKKQYSQNALNRITPSNYRRFPQTIHQIWIGKKPFPEKYKAWQKTWQSIPGWNYKLWTDKEVESYPLINRHLYNAEKNIGARADILRFEILYKEGGVYVDMDYECLRPELFDILSYYYDFYCGLTPLDLGQFTLNNAIIASIPGHPIIKACIDDLPHLQPLENPALSIVNKGPGLLTRMFYLYANRTHRDIAFPSSFLYPLPVYYMGRPHSGEKIVTQALLKKVKSEVVKPESIAVHWWEASWIMSDAWGY